MSKDKNTSTYTFDIPVSKVLLGDLCLNVAKAIEGRMGMEPDHTDLTIYILQLIHPLLEVIFREEFVNGEHGEQSRNIDAAIVINNLQIALAAVRHSFPLADEFINKLENELQ